MTLKPTSVRLDEELITRLDRLGDAYERSRGWLIAEAVKRFLEEEEAFNAKIEEGLADIKAGRVVSHEQVMAEMDALIEGFRSRKAAE